MGEDCDPFLVRLVQLWLDGRVTRADFMMAWNALGEEDGSMDAVGFVRCLPTYEEGMLRECPFPWNRSLQKIALLWPAPNKPLR